MTAAASHPQLPPDETHHPIVRLTDDVMDRLEQAFRLGLTQKLASQYAEIGQSTLWEWLRKGRRNQHPRCVELVAKLEKAEADGAARAMASIVAASKKNWTASAWIMERRHGYTRRDKVEVAHDHQVQISGSIQVEHTTSSVASSLIAMSAGQISGALMSLDEPEVVEAEVVE